MEVFPTGYGGSLIIFYVETRLDNLEELLYMEQSQSSYSWRFPVFSISNLAVSPPLLYRAPSVGLGGIYREESLLCLCRGLPEKAVLQKASVAFSSRSMSTRALIFLHFYLLGRAVLCLFSALLPKELIKLVVFIVKKIFETKYA